MQLTQASAQDLLERFGSTWAAFDGDGWADLFDRDVEYRPDPFEEPKRGREEARRSLLEASRTQEQVEFTPERMWVEGDTLIAPFHASYVELPSHARVREQGVLIAEVGGDGRITKLREWSHVRRSDGRG